MRSQISLGGLFDPKENREYGLSGQRHTLSLPLGRRVLERCGKRAALRLRKDNKNMKIKC